MIAGRHPSTPAGKLMMAVKSIEFVCAGAMIISLGNRVGTEVVANGTGIGACTGTDSGRGGARRVELVEDAGPRPPRYDRKPEDTDEFVNTNGVTS